MQSAVGWPLRVCQQAQQVPCRCLDIARLTYWIDAGSVARPHNGEVQGGCRAGMTQAEQHQDSDLFVHDRNAGKQL